MRLLVLLCLRLCLVLWVPGLVRLWVGLAGLRLVVLCRRLMFPRLCLWMWRVVWPCVFRVLGVCLVMVGVLWCCGGGRVLLVLVWVWLMGCWGLGVLVVVLPRLCVRLRLW